MDVQQSKGSDWFQDLECHLQGPSICKRVWICFGTELWTPVSGLEFESDLSLYSTPIELDSMSSGNITPWLVLFARMKRQRISGVGLIACRKQAQSVQGTWALLFATPFSKGYLSWDTATPTKKLSRLCSYSGRPHHGISINHQIFEHTPPPNMKRHEIASHG